MDNILSTNILSTMDNIFSIKDIAGPIETLPRPSLWPWIVVTLIIVGFIAYKLLHKTKPGTTAEVLPAKLSPLEMALQALETLLTEKLIEEGSTKLFFTKLNMILRLFMKKVYNPRISSQTTSELLISDDYNKKMSDDCHKQFSIFLHECDLFKFSDLKAQTDIALNAHKACRNLIVTIAREEGDQ